MMSPKVKWSACSLAYGANVSSNSLIGAERFLLKLGLNELTRYVLQILCGTDSHCLLYELYNVYPVCCMHISICWALLELVRTMLHKFVKSILYGYPFGHFLLFKCMALPANIHAQTAQSSISLFFAWEAQCITCLCSYTFNIAVQCT